LKKPFYIVLLLICSTPTLFAQQTDTLAIVKGWRKTSLFPLPIVYYTPETRWAGGLALFAAFRMPRQPDTHRPSQIQIGAAYTQRRQVLFYLPFQIFWDRERYQATGELGYYRYTYLFYGIGNDNPAANEETYDVNFPRIRINLLRLVRPHHYVGIRYWWDNYQINKIKSDGLLASGTITGSSGGMISGGGLLYNFDNRDDIFYPTRGFLIETESYFNVKKLGSTDKFSRLSIDAAAYTTVGRRTVLATNIWLTTARGDVPFQQLALIGGPRKMRGYFEGRLRDKNLWMVQAELRRSLGRRFGATIFGGMGAVAPDLSSFAGQKAHFTYGLGVRCRISKKEKVNLRLDLAGNELGEFAPYLTVKEAF
jgi:outer membrane protein assembly factor BamA